MGILFILDLMFSITISSINLLICGEKYGIIFLDVSYIASKEVIF